MTMIVPWPWGFQVKARGIHGPQLCPHKPQGALRKGQRTDLSGLEVRTQSDQNSRTGDGKGVSVSLANSHITPPMASRVALGHTQHHQSPLMPLGVPTASQITRTTNAPPKQNSRTGDGRWVSVSLDNHHFTPPMASRVALGHTQHHQSPFMPLEMPTASQITRTIKAPWCHHLSRTAEQGMASGWLCHWLIATSPHPWHLGLP